MRDYSKRIYLSIFWIIVGAALFAAGSFGKIDSFWSGMGGALIGVGIVQTIRWAHYRNNPEYKEKFDTQTHDERNHFIANKAWAWAGPEPRLQSPSKLPAWMISAIFAASRSAC